MTAATGAPFGSCLAISGYGGRLARWAALPADDWLADVNRLAAQQGLRSAAGAPLHFDFAAPADGRLSALAYECRIHDEGRISCRRDGTGHAHDRWNAAVWLRWPRAKAELNRLHAGDSGAAMSGDASGTTVPGRRSRVRDFATLLDESGLAWFSSRPDCDALLRERCWRRLFVEQRRSVIEGVAPRVIGHGLLGKLDRPYKRLTAQVLIVPVDASVIRALQWCRGTEAGDGDGQGATKAAVEETAVVRGNAARMADDATVTGTIQRMNEGGAVTVADIAIARRVREMAAGLSSSAAAAAAAGPLCFPLPVLALPGWSERNVDAGFYDDAAAFRQPAGSLDFS